MSGMSLKARIVEILEDDVGILAEVIVEEILTTLKIEESELSSFWAGRFIRLLDARLPPDISHRKQILRDVADLLIAAK